MSRGLILVVALTGVAHAQDALPPEAPPAPPAAPAPSPAPGPEHGDAATPAHDIVTPTEVIGSTRSPGKDEVLDLAEPGTSPKAPPDAGDQAIGAALGAAIGGRTTAGGLRVAGNYLYQLAEQDWFDGTAAFTFGSGDPACFRNRMDEVLCDHGVADGYEVEIGANVRHYVAGSGPFWPFVRGGLGVALVRFSDDDVTGIAIPLHLGGGLRASVADGIAIVGQVEIDVGIAAFSNGPGAEPQLGGSVSVGTEFRL